MPNATAPRFLLRKDVRKVVWAAAAGGGENVGEEWGVAATGSIALPCS